MKSYKKETNRLNVAHCKHRGENIASLRRAISIIQNDGLLYVRKVELSTLANINAGTDWKVDDLEEYKIEVQEKHEIQSSPIKYSLPEKGYNILMSTNPRLLLQISSRDRPK